MLGFPLLLIPFAIYNIIAFLMPDITWTGVVTTVHMVSGADWTMSAGDLLITLAIAPVVWRSGQIDAHRTSQRGRSRPLADPFPRHADRVYSGQAGRHRDVLPAAGDQLRRCAGRLRCDLTLGSTRPYDRGRFILTICARERKQIERGISHGIAAYRLIHINAAADLSPYAQRAFKTDGIRPLPVSRSRATGAGPLSVQGPCGGSNEAQSETNDCRADGRGHCT